MREATIQAKTVRSTANFGLRLPQPTAWLGLVVAGLIVSGSATAQQAAIEGVSEGDSAESVEEAPKFEVPPEPTRPYLDAIDRIESERGPYVSELSDLYLGLGEVFMKNGEFEKARDAYHRGVMVVRVNSGPNSPEQTNLLYLIANIETLLGETRQADEIMDNILFINTQYYGEHSPELLPVYDRIYEWYQTARPLDSDSSEYTDHDRIIELTEQMVETSEAANGPGDPDTALAYRRLGEAHFRTVRHLVEQGSPFVSLDGYVPVRTGTLHSRGIVEVSVRDHYLAGRSAFSDYLELLQSDDSKTPLEYAEALADVGDWYLALAKQRKARNLYEQAYQVLSHREEYAELADSYMGQPKPVHFFNGQLGLPEDALMESQEISLDISMTVTRGGDVRYVEILNAPEILSEDDLGDIRRELRHTPFRPAMKGGHVVTTKDFIWQHVIRPGAQTTVQPEERTS